MKLREFKRLNGAQRHAIGMGLDHDPLANGQVKMEDPRQGRYHMLRRVDIVVMQQDLVQRDARDGTLKKCAHAGSG